MPRTHIILLLSFLTTFTLSYAAFQQRVRYDGHSVVRASIRTEEHRALVQDMLLDVWSHDSNVPISDDVFIRVSPKQLVQLRRHGVHCEVHIKDVQALIDASFERQNKSSSNAVSHFFDDYHDFEEIVAETRRLVADHSDIVQYIPSIGQSVQGRDLIAVVLSTEPDLLQKRETGKPRFWFNGGQHAREWIGPATVMYILHTFLTGYGTDSEITNLLNKADIVIVPVVNPDGYDYSWTNERLWRKNRRRNSDGSYGVDLNRNWDDHWGGQGSSSNPRSDTYRGTGPFSEPETKAVSDFLSSFDDYVAAIDFHSYSQLILRPYGWTTAYPPNEDELYEAGEAMRTAIRNTNGKAYTNEASWELYFTTGSASDWFFGPAHINQSYTIELRDTGRYGFVLPASEIIPTGEEAFAAVMALAKQVLSF